MARTREGLGGHKSTQRFIVSNARAGKREARERAGSHSAGQSPDGRARRDEQARRRCEQGGARARHSRRKSSSQGEESLRGRPNWNRRARRAPSARELRGPDQIQVGKERIRARRGVLLGTQQRTEGDGACPGNSTVTGQKERHGTQGRGSGADRGSPGASKLGTGRESREGANGA
jgi:hypothetical protein